MKYITRLKLLIKNKQGCTYLKDMLFSLGILTLSILICILLQCFITCGEIKKTTKQEMNNLSSIIAADIYNANKQGNLAEYYKQLNISSIYRKYLLDTTVNNISKDLNLKNISNYLTKYNVFNEPVYYLSQFNLSQENKADRIEYTISFTTTLNFRFCGKVYDGFVFPITYQTYHIKNY